MALNGLSLCVGYFDGFAQLGSKSKAMQSNLFLSTLTRDIGNHFANADLLSAQHAVDSAFGKIRTVNDCTAVFRRIPAVFYGYNRLSAWLRLEKKLSVFDIHLGSADYVDRERLKLRIRLALHDYEGYLSLYRKISTNMVIKEALSQEGYVAERIEAAEFPDFGAPKIFGIGLSRTGTTSLHEALQVLGYRSWHFFNKITNCPLDENDFGLHDAFTDISVSCRFEELYFAFRKAKFICTVRDKQDWLSSIKRHTKTIHGTDDFKVLRKSSSLRSASHKPLYGLFEYKLYFQYENFEEAFDIYSQRVFEFFANKTDGRILFLDIKSPNKWKDLCEFLDSEKPSIDYPHNNSTISS